MSGRIEPALLNAILPAWYSFAMLAAVFAGVVVVEWVVAHFTLRAQFVKRATIRTERILVGVLLGNLFSTAVAFASLRFFGNPLREHRGYEFFFALGLSVLIEYGATELSWRKIPWFQRLVAVIAMNVVSYSMLAMLKYG